MSTEHSVYSAHEEQKMLSSMREMNKSLRLAQTEKQQLQQVCACRRKVDGSFIIIVISDFLQILLLVVYVFVAAFGALMLLVGWQEGHPGL